ncbi:MAG: hypothetical protein QXJ75_05665 [Candidatus Bathyarchaeia archaeon]
MKTINFIGAVAGVALLLIGGYFTVLIASGPATLGMWFLVILMGVMFFGAGLALLLPSLGLTIFCKTTPARLQALSDKKEVVEKSREEEAKMTV